MAPQILLAILRQYILPLQTQAWADVLIVVKDNHSATDNLSVVDAHYFRPVELGQAADHTMNVIAVIFGLAQLREFQNCGKCEYSRVGRLSGSAEKM